VATRKSANEAVETEILYASRRRCALCFGIYGDLTPKRGQLAHVDRDSSKSEFDDFGYLCLPHHDEYDSQTSQSKRFTPSELRRHRNALYEYVRSGQPLAEVSSAKRTEDKPFLALVGNSFGGGILDLQLRNEGAPVNCLEFHSSTPACSVLNWYPRSLSNGQELRARVQLATPTECAFRMHVRDRSDAERIFEIKLDLRPSPPAFDVLEIF
jgi:hypothetical protein